MHNYNYYSDDVIFEEKFKEPLQHYLLFTADNVIELKDFLEKKLNKGNGMEVLNRIEESKYRPSKKLMNHVGNKGQGEVRLCAAG